MKKQTKLSVKSILSSLKKHRYFLETNLKKNLIGNKLYTITTKESEANKKSCFLLYDGVYKKAKERITKSFLEKISFIVLDNPDLIKNLPPSTLYILVKSTRKAWSILAAEAHNNPQDSLKIVAITGTNGKTTTAWMLTKILASLGFKAGYIGTLGSSFCKDQAAAHTTPDPDVLFQQLHQAKVEGYEYVTLEASSHAIDLGKLSAIKFSALVFTSFSRDHLDYHKTLEHYLKTKLSLFLNNRAPLAPSFIHTNLIPLLEKKFLEQVNPIFYCEQQQRPLSSHLKVYSYRKKQEDLRGTTLSLSLQQKDHTAKIPFLGQHNSDNFFVATLVAERLTHKIQTEKWQNIKQIPGRLERVLPKQESLPAIFIDFSHTPDALRKSLSFIKKHNTQGRTLVVFGCGGERDKGKRPLMGAAAEEIADQIILTADNPRRENLSKIIASIKKGIKAHEKILVIHDRKQAIYKALDTIKKEDCLLLAGKGHETYQEIEETKHPFSEKKIIEEYYQMRLTNQ